jgi:hypothetical protein
MDPPPLVGCTTTLLAVMVVPLVVPRTRTLTPFLMTPAELVLVPARYFVEDPFLTVTFWPADVKIVKLDLETLSTVPDDPPAAGPDRAFDPPLRGACCPEIAEVELAAVVAPEPVLAVALTMPYAPPPIAMAVAPVARSLVSLEENMGSLRFHSGGIQRASQFPLGVPQEEAGTFLREPRPDRGGATAAATNGSGAYVGRPGLVGAAARAALAPDRASSSSVLQAKSVSTPRSLASPVTLAGGLIAAVCDPTTHWADGLA